MVFGFGAWTLLNAGRQDKKSKNCQTTLSTKKVYTLAVFFGEMTIKHRTLFGWDGSFVIWNLFDMPQQ